MFINHTDTIHSIAVEKTLLSDHDMVVCDLRFHRPKSKPNNISPVHPFDTMDLHSANWEAINHDLSHVDWSFTHTHSPTNIKKSWQSFVDTVTNVCAKHIPLRSVNISKCRIPRNSKSLIRKIKRINSGSFWNRRCRIILCRSTGKISCGKYSACGF